jgi:hypothetical protein
LDYIQPTPLDLKTDEEKFEKRGNLTRQLKNAVMIMLDRVRIKNKKVNFNDIVQDIILKNKQ